MRGWTLVMLGAAASLAACQTGPRSRADLVMDSSPCADSQFTVYFNEGSNRLTRPASQLISATGEGLRGCDIRGARVVGLADSTGTPQANQTLSQRRAVVVAEALRRSGFPAPQFELAAMGEDGAVTADGREDPVRRRAEVYLTVAPK